MSGYSMGSKLVMSSGGSGGGGGRDAGKSRATKKQDHHFSNKRKPPCVNVTLWGLSTCFFAGPSAGERWS